MPHVNSSALSPVELAILRLRGLYEQYGYRKYQTGQFEEYGLYLEFKRFLHSGRILSFTDLDGRLLALKPDVTLSIAKNARLENGTEKVYYLENVYRESIASGTIKEIGQMGLEFFGGDTAYAQAEVLLLARETLAAIGPDFVLEISHMGFLTGLFEALGLEADARGKIMEALSAKSPHGVSEAAERAGVAPEGTETLRALCRLSGNYQETLAQARALCLNDRMKQALEDLEKTVNAVGEMSGLRLDFTLQGDLEYYDGLMMAGYLDGAPKAVLSGGRYDGLMKKLGRPAGAVGFALYLDELKRLPREKAEWDVDVLVLAEDGCDVGSLLRTVRNLVSEGLRVRVESKTPPRLRYARLLRYEKGGLTEC